MDLKKHFFYQQTVQSPALSDLVYFLFLDLESFGFTFFTSLFPFIILFFDRQMLVC